jgi:hypothetical protein
MADVDWSQFSASPPAQAAPPPAVDWGQFSAAPPDQTGAGPPQANFSNVQGAAAPPMGQFAGQVANAQQSAMNIGAALFDPEADMETAATLATGLAAPIAGGIAGLGQAALNQVGDFVADAQNAVRDITGGGAAPTPTMFAGQPHGQDAASAVQNASEALQYAPETEHGRTLAGGVGEVMALPAKAGRYLGEKVQESTGSPLAAAAIDTATQAAAFAIPGPHFLKGAGELAHVDAAALAGEKGPGAQGVALGQTIMNEAEGVSSGVSPVVPDAALGVPPAAGPEAVPPVPAEAVPQAPPAPERLPDAAAAAQTPETPAEITAPSQPAAHAEPDELSHDDIDAMVSAGHISPETANKLKGMVDREAPQAPQDVTRIDGGVPEPAWRDSTAARDESGAPATLYRGSREGSTSPEAFDQLGAATGHPSAQLGVFFTDDPGDAAAYGQVSEHHLDLRNPKVYDIADFPGFDTPEEAQSLRKQLESEGHDGIVIDANSVGGPKQYIAFEPHQVLTPKEAPELPARLAGERAKETPHAQDVRNDQGQAGESGQVPAGGEVGSRGDLQPTREAAGNALPERLRGPREAADGAVPPEVTTSIKRAKVIEERALKGQDEVHYEGKRTFGEAWQKASGQLAEDPHAGQNLARRIVDDKHKPSGEEVALLHQDRMRIQNEHRQAVAEAGDAMEKGDAAAEQTARAKMRELDDQLELSDKASKHSGHEQGFAFAMRRMASREDYSMAELRLKAKVAKGAPLSAEESAHIETLSRRIAEQDARIAELEKARHNRPTDGRAPRNRPQGKDQEFSALSAKLKALRDHIECAA